MPLCCTFDDKVVLFVQEHGTVDSDTVPLDNIAETELTTKLHFNYVGRAADRRGELWRRLQRVFPGERRRC